MIDELMVSTSTKIVTISIGDFPRIYDVHV